MAWGQKQSSSLSQFSEPQRVTVDHLGHIYIADFRNHRIMCWLTDEREGSIVVERNGRESESNQSHDLFGLSFDRESNLYVADCGNHRILKFIVDVD